MCPFFQNDQCRRRVGSQAALVVHKFSLGISCRIKVRNRFDRRLFFREQANELAIGVLA
jgi:hypothetical protein